MQNVAIYHLSAKVIGRKSGRSSVAAAAYRTAERLQDNRQGIEHDYRRKGGVVHTEIMAPRNAPDWMSDRDQLWNAVEAIEKRKDAQLAREIEVALPRELGRAERLDLLRGFVQREFVDRGMIADVAVHEAQARDGQVQPHAHVMLTMRELAGEGFGKKDREWNASDLLVGWREAWARDANEALERAGLSERIDHRTLDAQREDAERDADRAWDAGQDELALDHEKKVVELSREPEPKIGSAANALEKRGIETERGDAFRAAQERNVRRQDLGWTQLELKLELIERGRAFIESAKERLDALWERVENAMNRIRGRVSDGVERPVDPEVTKERDDLAERRAAILGQHSDRDVERQAAEVVRDDVDGGRESQDRHEAILGRHRDGDDGESRDPSHDCDRER